MGKNMAIQFSANTDTQKATPKNEEGGSEFEKAAVELAEKVTDPLAVPKILIGMYTNAAEYLKKLVN